MRYYEVPNLPSFSILNIEPRRNNEPIDEFLRRQVEAPALKIVNFSYEPENGHSEPQEGEYASPFDFSGHGPGVEGIEKELQQTLIQQAIEGRMPDEWVLCEVVCDLLNLNLCYRHTYNPRCSITLKIKHDVSTAIAIRDSTGNIFSLSHGYEHDSKQRDYFEPWHYLRTGLKTLVREYNADNILVREFCYRSVYAIGSFFSQLIFFLFKIRRERSVDMATEPEAEVA